MEGRNTYNRWSKEKLIQIARENIEQSTTMSNWRAYTRKVNEEAGKIVFHIHLYIKKDLVDGEMSNKL